MKVRLLHLYPDRMNIYGDFGNIACLQQRLRWRGIDFEYVSNSIGDKLSGEFDLIFMGGGQDVGQMYVGRDLQQKSQLIHDHIERNVPVLTICGAYQLFGQYFTTSDSEQIEGIHVFNVVTKATEKRMIGNIVVESPDFGTLVGFENHSGATQLLEGAKPLGKVLKGYGNDESSGHEGIIYKQAIGTYMHGSFLPKNPPIADHLLAKALQNIDSNYNLSPLDDWLEMEASAIAQKRP